MTYRNGPSVQLRLAWTKKAVTVSNGTTNRMTVGDMPIKNIMTVTRNVPNHKLKKPVGRRPIDILCGVVNRVIAPQGASVKGAVDPVQHEIRRHDVDWDLAPERQ